MRTGWSEDRVKVHLGILGNEATDVCDKQAAEGATLDDQCPGGYQAVGEAVKREYIEGGGEEEVMKRAVGWTRRAVTKYCRVRGRKRIGK